MTVANNNLSSGILSASPTALNVSIKSAKSSGETGLTTSNISPQPNNLTAEHSAVKRPVIDQSAIDTDNTAVEVSFEALVQQKLSADSAEMELQAIDSNDVVPQLLSVEIGDVQVIDGIENSSHWLQVLKSHFTSDEDSIANGEGNGVEIASLVSNSDSGSEIDQATLKGGISVLSEPLVSQSDEVNVSVENISLIDNGGISGDKLPLPGQAVSAIKSAAKDQGEQKTVPLIKNVSPDYLSTNQVTQNSTPLNNQVFTGQGEHQAAAIVDSLAAKPVSKESPLSLSLLDTADVQLNEEGEFNIEKLLMDNKAAKPENQQMPASAIKDAAISVNSVTNLSAPQSVSPQLLNQSASQLPANLQTMSLSPQSTNSQWGEALGERISFLVNHKLNNAQIRMDPPHLGKLDIQISVKDDAATITIHTQHAQTRDMIDSASARLREFLQEAGYNSVDVDVSQRDQSMQQDLSQQGNQASIEDNQDTNSSETDVDLASTSNMTSMSFDNGRIDYFA